MKCRVLILGGTRMARLLAEHLDEKHQIIYSIAGNTKAALLPKNCTQISGGFGGAAGLYNYIRAQNIDICIDATHPFAQNISQNALSACAQAQIPIIEYARKIWQVDGAQQFQTTEDLIAALPDDGRILLTIGGQNITSFLTLQQYTIARMIEPPELQGKSTAENFKISLSRPPYRLDDEIMLMKKHQISHLICKNSGGDQLADKLIAAQSLGIDIFMLARPISPHKTQFFEMSEIDEYINHHLSA